MSSLKSIKLYSHAGGPNPWKVVMMLNELDVPYTTDFVDFSKIKQEPFITVNPNGRVPAIEDPNTGITLWESGAIVEYLVDTYDKEHKLSYTTSPEKYEVMQWAMFQMSGQGPYYGQAAWFVKFHSEQLPSAQERYKKEMERVISVLDLHLSRQKEKQGASGGKEVWLVGDKCTWADIMFVPWGTMVPWVFPDNDILAEGKYPHYQDWFKRLTARPAVKKALDDKAALAAKH